MTYPRRTVDALSIPRRASWLAAVVVAGCAKAPPPQPPALPPITIAAPVEAKVKATMTIVAAKDVNPDSSGAARPIVVRVYTLRADAAFSSADFFALFNDEEKTLGAEMITHDEFVLDPGDEKTMDIAISKETRFVGVLAAFRDIRNAQPWRVTLPTPKGSFRVSVERSRVAAAAAAG